MRGLEVLETCVYADDLEAARAFYEGVLGLEPMVADPERHLFFRLGRGMFMVFRPEATVEPGGSVPPHGARGPGHVAFAVEGGEVDAWRRHLMAAGIEVEAEHTWPRGGRSLYLRDPAGNSVELAEPRIWGLDAEAVLRP